MHKNHFSFIEKYDFDHAQSFLRKKSEVKHVDIEVNEINAILEYAKNKLLVSASDSNWKGMFIIKDFSFLREIDEPSFQNTGTYWLEKIPGFD